MTSRARFCRILPLSQVSLAALFGGFGLWERNKILSHDYLFGIGWDTTLRFHVWPWPFKFAVVTNLPAMGPWALLTWPIAQRWPDLPEDIAYAPVLLFVAILWYGIGVWMDRRWSSETRSAFRMKTPWVLLSVFTVLCLTAAFIHIQHPTSDYMLVGAGIWLATGLGIGITTVHRTIFGKP